MASHKKNKTRKILFICTGNCVRSQMAEVFLNYRSAGRYEAFSAGWNPAGYIHPFVSIVLRELRIPKGRKLTSKSWDVFAKKDFDAIITLCDVAQQQKCDYWPKRTDSILPVRAHWPVQDPILVPVMGEEAKVEEFRIARDLIRDCTERMAILPDEVFEDDRAFSRAIHAISRDMQKDWEQGHS
ncbi:MAG: arsenate reductase ArsC [Candidatus Sumerlaeia bacterium]